MRKPTKSEEVLREVLRRERPVRNIDIAKTLKMKQYNVRKIADMLASRSFIKIKRVKEQTETAILPKNIIYYELRPQKRARAIELMKEIYGDEANVDEN